MDLSCTTHLVLIHKNTIIDAKSNMLSPEFLSVLEVQTRDELHRQILQFARLAGFDLFTAMVVIDEPCGPPTFIRVHNTPAAYRGTFENLERGRVDPVMQQCKRSSAPIAWDQATYVSAGVADRWEHQAAFGYKAGIAMAMHMPNARHFFIGVDRDKPLPKARNELTRMVADLQLLLVQASESAMHILVPEGSRRELPQLTPRERETLQWTMDGKTAWELGQILGISEQTAARHIYNAIQKLGCVNKVQAVAKAVRMGLV